MVAKASRETRVYRSAERGVKSHTDPAPFLPSWGRRAEGGVGGRQGGRGEEALEPVESGPGIEEGKGAPKGRGREAAQEKEGQCLNNPSRGECSLGGSLPPPYR